ncbi:hypothetical protein SBA2_10041 [Acidobacteriia bacterium SbA2]|nr:hypothetical protein SBA2_10041 [Acidobacteriia bacterium SbA2]
MARYTPTTLKGAYMPTTTVGTYASPANPSSYEKSQEFGGADDPDAAKLFQFQQVLISADDVLRTALKSAFEDHVIFGVAAGRCQRLGNLDHLQKAQIVSQRFRDLVPREMEAGPQLLRQFLHQFRASEDRELAGPRPLDALKGISPPARRGKQDVGVENGSKRQGYFSCSKASTKDSRSSSDKRSQSSPRWADARRSCASAQRIRSSRPAWASWASASRAARLRSAGNPRTSEMTCSSLNSKVLISAIIPSAASLG